MNKSYKIGKKLFKVGKTLIEPALITLLGAAIVINGAFVPIGLAVAAVGVVLGEVRVLKAIDPNPNEKSGFRRKFDAKWAQKKPVWEKRIGNLRTLFSKLASSLSPPEPPSTTTSQGTSAQRTASSPSQRDTGPKAEPKATAQQGQAAAKAAPNTSPPPTASQGKPGKKDRTFFEKGRIFFEKALMAVGLGMIGFGVGGSVFDAKANGGTASGQTPTSPPPPTPTTIEPPDATTADLLNNTTGNATVTGAVDTTTTPAGPNPYDPDAPYYNPLPEDIPIHRCGDVSDDRYNAVVEALTKVPPGLRDMLFKHVEINVGRTMADIHPERSKVFYLPDSIGRVSDQELPGFFRVNADGKIEINIAEWYFNKAIDLSDVVPIDPNAVDQKAEKARYLADVGEAARDQGLCSEPSVENGWMHETPDGMAAHLLHEIGHFEYALENLSKNEDFLSGFDRDRAHLGSKENAAEQKVNYYYTNNNKSTEKGNEAAAECTKEYLQDGLSDKTTKMEGNFPETYHSTVDAIKETTANLDPQSVQGKYVTSASSAESCPVSTTPFDNFMHSVDTTVSGVSHSVGAALSGGEHAILSHIDFNLAGIFCFSGIRLATQVGLTYLQYHDPEQFVGTKTQYVCHKVSNATKKSVRAVRKANNLSHTKYASLKELHKKALSNKKLKIGAKTPRSHSTVKTPKPSGM
ncbi:MAG: hypothetical protein PHW76_08560 [Alphaproteobacteria bacterium]|nr:hypothetical protein [Alphaproteobacteria bacterium]